MNRQVAERRKNHRLETEPLQPSLVLGPSDEPAVLKNISASGLACISTTPIPEMTLVEMFIQLPALPEEEVDRYPLRCKGAVVRCEPVSRSNSRRKWLLAIYFTDLDPEGNETLHRYIERRS